MPAGRPPKSLQEKMLSGARIRKDRDADAKIANAAVDLIMPPCPAWLTGAARKHWDTLGPALVDAGLLSAIDGDVFALHCDNVAAYEQAMAQLTELKDWVERTPNGFAVQSAWLQIRNKLQEQIIKTAREFGLTPASRSAVKVGQPQQGSLFGDTAVAGDSDPYASFGIRQS